VHAVDANVTKVVLVMPHICLYVGELKLYGCIQV